MSFVDRIVRSRPVRAFEHFTRVHGSAYAQAMTLSGFFSLFAGLFLAFAAASTLLRSDEALENRVLGLLSTSIPGLIDTGGGGAIPAEALIDSSIASWAAAIGAVSILFTAIAWIGVSREGFRTVLGLPDVRQGLPLVKLGDLAVAICIGLLVLLSSAGIVATSALAEVFGVRGIGVFITHVAQFVLDAAIVMLMYRFAGRLVLPWRRLLAAAIACALTFQLLKLIAAVLFSGIEKNPLLASIATVAVILVWLGVTNHVLLFVLAIVAMGNVGTEYAKSVALAYEDRDQLDLVREARRAELRERVDQPNLNRRIRKVAKRLRRN